ncbi:MAG TPA: NAD-dependent epimerase/dehydratase family protein, partial [Bradyrhizobium sp.]
MGDQAHQRRVLVLGASGLIGRFVTDDLRARGFHAIGIARSFPASQKTSSLDLELPILPMPAAALARLMRDHAVDVIVNCLGVLQDGPGSDTGAVHRDVVARLLQAIDHSGRTVRFIHISIPGAASEDRTAFATTKRAAEALITASNVAYAILRPGFVVAPAAYGGSAMIRALAAFPIDLPTKESATPFQPVAIEAVAETIAWLAARDPGDAEVDAVTWDLMQSESVTLGGVIEQFRYALGTAAGPRVRLPSFLLDVGAKLGDLANRLGWMPPMRTTAIAELR